MQLRYSLTANDIRVAQSVADSACRAEIGRPFWFKLFLALVGISGALAMAATLGMYQKYPSPITSDFSWVVVPIAIMLFGIVVLVRLAKTTFANLRLAQLGPFPIEQSLSVSDAGVHIEGPGGTCFLPWSAIRSIQELPGHIAITSLQWLTFVVPNSAFQTTEQKTEFKSHFEKHISP